MTVSTLTRNVDVKLMTPRFQLDYLCLLLLKIGLIVKLLPESCIAMLKLKCLRHRCFRWFSHYKKSSPSSLPLLILLNIQYRHHHSSVTFIIHPCFLYVTKCCLRECIYGMYTNLYSQLWKYQWFAVYVGHRYPKEIISIWLGSPKNGWCCYVTIYGKHILQQCILHTYFIKKLFMI